MCMTDVVIEIMPACEFLIAFITLICLCCLFTPSTMILQLTARTSAKNPVVQVKDVDVRNDDKEPFENDTKLFECKTWLISRYDRMHTKLFLNQTAHASKVLRPLIQLWMWKMPMWTKSRQCTLLYKICKHTVDMRRTSWGYLFHFERTAKRKNKGSWYFPELTSNVWLKHLYWTFLIYVCPRLSSILVFLFSHCIESNSQNSYCDPMSEWLWQVVLGLFKLKILNDCDRIFYGKEMCSVRAEVTWYQPYTMCLVRGFS